MSDPSCHEFIWPLPRPHLAKLVDVGLSDENIAACFSVDREDVRLLRERYRLADEPNGRQDNPSLAANCLDELSNGVQAATSYANSALKYASSRDGDNETAILLIEKAVEQLLRVGRAYQSLQTSLGSESDQ